MSELYLFGEDEFKDCCARPAKSRDEIFSDYEAFTKKFTDKPKTTDDCFTPPEVYDCVLQWVNENVACLDGVPVVRPFYPGGDYTRSDYPDGCIVIDNPPFSILAKIRRFYQARRIRYFLFAPTLTMCSCHIGGETFVVTHADVVYENMAVVNTSFVTNLDCGGTALWVAGDLKRRIETANAERVKERKRKGAGAKRKYIYPKNVTSAAMLGKVLKGGITLKFPAESLHHVKTADCSSLFGGGFLVSDSVAAEIRAAESEVVELSWREKNIVKRLNEHGKRD